VLSRGVEQDADLASRAGQIPERAAHDSAGAAGRSGQADDHPHGRRLRGAVGAQEPGDPAGTGVERDVVHGRRVAVPFREVLHGNHDRSFHDRGGVAVSGDGRKPLKVM
jgi:hypothetical protein